MNRITKDIGVLFKDSMVRAIRANAKTQTRRPLYVLTKGNAARAHASYPPDYGNGFFPNVPPGHAWSLSRWADVKPGDRMWVRETGWERPERTPKMMREGADTWAPYYFDADGITQAEAADFKAWGFKRRPSIHMPRWANRISLEITGVRVERLQDISEADAIAEGCNPFAGLHGDDDMAVEFTRRTMDRKNGGLHPTPMPVVRYAVLWESINGPDSWAANPWVWAITFKVIKP